MNDNLYEITLDHTQMLHLHQALLCHNSALCEEYFDNDTPEIPEELKVVSDMYHVIKGVLDKELTFENPLSTEQSLVQVKEIDLDDWAIQQYTSNKPKQVYKLKSNSK